MPKYAEVVVGSYTGNTEGLNIYDYRIPEKFDELVESGMRVIVPFGKRMLEGYVVAVKGSTDIEKSRIRPIESIPDLSHVFNDKGILLARWMAEKYMCSLTDTLQCILPSEMVMKENRYIALNEITDDKMLGLSNYQESIVNTLKSCGGIIELKKFTKLGFDISREFKTLVDIGRLSIITKMEADVRDRFIRGIELNCSIEEIEKLIYSMETKKAQKNQSELLKVLKSLEGPAIERNIIKDYGFSKGTIQTLAKKNIIRYVDIKVSRDPYARKEFARNGRPVLTQDQTAVLNKIIKGYEDGKREYLLHGVTGSGKTEIYMRLIEYMIDNGKQAIMLVPEISLTPQTIERFKGRFERVAVMHSRLSSGEKYDEWKRIKNNEVDVVVGARSAVFAPSKNLGVIIIDEEHENSYKSDKTPKYVTKDVAYERCQIEGALLVLGSATPSIDTYYEAQKGKYIICDIKKRVDNREMPEIELADMRQEIVSGNKTIFSRRLYQEINSALNDNHQIILFLNRRGHSTFVSCRKCGLVMKCPRCDVSLTYHADNNMLNCHYCGYAVKSPDTCPSCKSRYIKYFGIGTQRLEGEVRKYFPSARVLRMDLDTTSGKGSHDKIYNAFKNREADILIGTQMISKGLDFPGVTLVGIMAADQSLNMPDYRSSERTFQLITQVAGRAGRGEYSGRVIVQTYDPDHYSILAALHQDYQEFYNKEILIRETFNYPPFTDLVNIIVSSRIEKETENAIKELTDMIKNVGYDGMGISILGPSPAPISKINTYYRWQTIIKGNVDNQLKNAIWSVSNLIYGRNKKVKISIDINPVNLL